MPQETKSIHHHTELEPAQGLCARSADPEALRKAIMLALDYRGDVTLERRVGEDGSGPSEGVECFIFDVKGDNDSITAVRAIAKGSDEKIAIPFSEIECVTFTGRDTAAGKSFETWMKNYVKKKLAGEEASIHSEQFD